MNKISVILRSRNEERWIGHTIQSILDFIDQPEIIVMDNESNDSTLEIVKHFIRDAKLKNSHKSSYTQINIKNIKNYSPGSALNNGIKMAANNIILIISSHCVIKKFDYKKLILNMNNYDCIFGNQIPVYNGKRINKRYIWSHFEEKKIINMFSKQENRFFLHNAFALYNKKILEQFPFNENVVGKEDRYWVNDRIEEGLTSFYDSTLICNHHYTDNGATWKGMG